MRESGRQRRRARRSSRRRPPSSTADLPGGGAGVAEVRRPDPGLNQLEVVEAEHPRHVQDLRLAGEIESRRASRGCRGWERHAVRFSGCASLRAWLSRFTGALPRPSVLLTLVEVRYEPLCVEQRDPVLVGLPSRARSRRYVVRLRLGGTGGCGQDARERHERSRKAYTSHPLAAQPAPRRTKAPGRRSGPPRRKPSGAARTAARRRAAARRSRRCRRARPPRGRA